ncbi:MAG: hypothetical protein K0S11_1161 [Gammaproteobacteria bacterium]|nr:hypothetical protein [Gammaproteobacteria bacterium]
MAIPQSFIDELLNRTDIVEVVDQRIPLRKRGSNHTACCPFHNEKTPSFSVSQSKQIYHCFGCGAGGNAISFLMNYDKLGFTEAIEQLANAIGLPLPEENKSQSKNLNSHHLHDLLAQIAIYYQKQLRQHPDAQCAIDYLKQRGFTGAIAKTFGIGYVPEAWDSLSKAFPRQQEHLLSCGMLIKNDQGRCYDRFRNRIMFPIRNQRGKVIGFGGRIIEKGEPKYLNSPETPLFHKGSELYGLYEACQANRQLERILIVEGYLDVIALAQYGITYAVATLGTATTPEHLKKLFRYAKELVFCFDGDAAGQSAAWKALEITLPFMEDGRQVRFLILPPGHDPDSHIRTLEPEDFASQVAAAMPLEDFLFNKLRQGINLESSTGKAQLVKEVSERLNLLPKGSLKPILLEQLAKLLKLNTTTMQQMLQNRVKPEGKTKTPLQRPLITARSAPSLVRHAIAILLQYPQLLNQLAVIPDFNQTDAKGLAFLFELITLLKANPNYTTGSLLEHWRDHAYSKQLKNLATYQLNGSPQDLLQELQDALTRLMEEQQLQALWEKYQQGQLADTEKTLLYQMLKNQHVN